VLCGGLIANEALPAAYLPSVFGSIERVEATTTQQVDQDAVRNRSTASVAHGCFTSNKRSNKEFIAYA
jgi:hypothetical protein